MKFCFGQFIALLISVIPSRSLIADSGQKELIDQEWVVRSYSAQPVGSCDTGVSVLIPKGAKGVVQIIHGSGNSNRDGSNLLAGAAIYRDMARALYKNGYASIRFDKRNSNPNCIQGVSSIEFTHKVFLDDARNVLTAALRRFPELASLPTFVLGHSQGVQFANLLGLEQELGLSGVVFAAGLGEFSIGQTLLRQFKDCSKKEALSSEQREVSLKSSKQVAAYFKKLSNHQLEEDAFLIGAYRNFWRDWEAITKNSKKLAAELDIPALVIQGSLDTNVIEADYIALAEATSETAGSQAVWLESLQLLFMKEGSLSVDETFHHAVAAWLDRVLGV